MKIDFTHIQSAHCESGVTRNLLRHIGVDKMTEPLAFGIGAGLFFVYVPFIKINNGPAIAFRTLPGQIFSRTCKSLGISVFRKKFGDMERAEAFLMDCLEKGQPAGCQVGVYFLSYFPKEYRFHFNAHNLVVYGKEADNYLISDPVMEEPTMLTSYELGRVRFAKGALAPRGQLYYPRPGVAITDEQIKRAIRTGINKNIHRMLHIPGPIAGVKGIRYTGRRIKTWRDKLGLHKAGLYLAQLVRMQEEIGTGGGGFRYMYGAFLQEAFVWYPYDELHAISGMFTRSGDSWREAAILAAGIYKGRIGSQQDFNSIGDHLLEIAELERQAFVTLSKIKWHR
ncbi:MAG: BtrH N-terminal domain-containing protein [Bacteroidota bacterium]|nr:BtrH N-terminal domain-containing protein [Bacteroidota bacterium]MDP4216215.1 BtrH N-terminal domain-containing protein [Bacteroidota bacterium]MDP4245126.1 BtrH N-terminal domain-containing protein [Bacteroidota bacterium]MDP4253344.1 BtrH N-terminal domain-containing protein [Bacteroidota bacterium]MDP4256787.1 BtrH N-terminal domain-containing protein [Bacteroidota bacterium]